MSKIISLLDGMQKTNDMKYSANGLKRRIKRIVHKVNTTSDSDEQITEFIVGCFAGGGLVDTYNKLGIIEWDIMITQMAEHEVWERNVRNERI